ncbi:Uncharacterised protein [Yersinia pseudotuberculosis]|nr:Uncharacterised protein [Yersinia pseudotuberculosis]
MLPAFFQHHINLKPRQFRRQLDPIQPLQRDKHKLFAEGKVLQQELITTERTVGLRPQCILLPEPQRREMAVQRLAISLPRQPDPEFGGIQGQRLMQGAGQRRIGIKIERQAAQVDTAPVGQRAAIKAQPDNRPAIGFTVQFGSAQCQREQVHILRGGVAAASFTLTNGAGQHFKTFAHPHAFFHPLPLWGELHNGKRRNGAQVVRPQQADQPFGQLRQVIIQFFSHAAHQEGKAFKQAFHIGVTRPGFIQI